MLYGEIIAVCSQIHTKHINTLCGQNVELLNVKLAVHIVTTGLWTVDVPVRSYTHTPNFLLAFVHEKWENWQTISDLLYTQNTASLRKNFFVLFPW